MSYGDNSRGSVETEEAAGRLASLEERLPEPAPARLPGGARSRAVAGVGGGVLALRGLRQFRRGARIRGLAQAVVGAALLAAAAARRRSSGRESDERTERPGGVEPTDVVDTAPDLDEATDPGGSSVEHAGGEAAADVVDTSPDVADAATPAEDRGPERASGDEAADVVSTGPDLADAGSAESAERTDDAAETGGADEDAADEFTWGEGDATDGETEDEDNAAEGTAGNDAEGATGEFDERLGEVEYDDETGTVPVPEQAIDEGFLAPDGEVAWGIRESDDTVVVSGEEDAIEDREGLTYVTDSAVDEGRLQVPGAIDDHWDVVGDAAVGVESGDDLLFVTSDDLRDADLLAVVPAAWADDEGEDAAEE